MKKRLRKKQFKKAIIEHIVQRLSTGRTLNICTRDILWNKHIIKVLVKLYGNCIRISNIPNPETNPFGEIVTITQWKTGE